MVLKGGSLKFTAGNTPEDVILAILQDDSTTIVFISENHNYRGVSVFIFKITVAEKFKYTFDRSGLPLYTTESSKTVIILKFFVYNHDPTSALIVNNEVSTQERLASRTSSQQICPSVLYCKDIKDGTLDNAILNFLKHNQYNTVAAVSQINQGKTMYQYIESQSERGHEQAFHSLKKKAFFMEFFSCKSLLNFCDIPQHFAEGKSVTSIDGIQLDIVTNRDNPKYVLGLDKDSFKKMALHYVTLKLFNFNCIHGDLHTSNVYVLLDDTNIVFLVIDLGDGKIDDNLQLKLDEIHLDKKLTIRDPKLTDEVKYNVLYFNLSSKWCIRKNEDADYLTRLYLELIKHDDAYNNMYKYIKTLIDNKTATTDYFRAAVIINMCIEINSPHSSIFAIHLGISIRTYMPVFCRHKDLATETMCNQIIEQCLYPRTETEIPPKIAKTNGGGSIYKNRINKFIASKQINNKSKKSKKSKKRKNKTINRKKSRKITRKKLKNRRKK
jgi:hypothetical protein